MSLPKMEMFGSKSMINKKETIAKGKGMNTAKGKIQNYISVVRVAQSKRIPSPLGLNSRRSEG